MALTYDTNEYQIPRGRVFFDRFDTLGNKTGERYLGNCPSFTIEITSEKAEHYSSEAGLRQKDQSVVVQVDRMATLRVDNMSMANVGLFLSGAAAAADQSADSEATEELTVEQGLYYQLGITESSPVGARNISDLVVTSTDSSPVTYTEGDDYEVDEALGRIQILADGLIAASAAETIACTYAVAAAGWDQVATGTVSEVQGAIRFISDNATGDERDAYMPLVTLTPTGQMALVSDGTDFNAMEFSLDILAPQNGAAIYFSGRPVAA